MSILTWTTGSLTCAREHSDMDYRIFNVRTWTFLSGCVYLPRATGIEHGPLSARWTNYYGPHKTMAACMPASCAPPPPPPLRMMDEGENHSTYANKEMEVETEGKTVAVLKWTLSRTFYCVGQAPRSMFLHVVSDKLVVGTWLAALEPLAQIVSGPSTVIWSWKMIKKKKSDRRTNQKDGKT